MMDKWVKLTPHAMRGGCDTNCLNTYPCSIKNAMHGMTLLELVVVIALMSIIALSATTLIFDTGEWQQQDVTETQWLAARDAIIGDHQTDDRGQIGVAGFASDMGRLPECLRELVRPYSCAANLSTDSPDLPNYTQDADSNVAAGWRGPYVSNSGSKVFRDGWNNQGADRGTATDVQPYYDDVNYGWLFGTGENDGVACSAANVVQKQVGAIILQSCSSDGDVSIAGAGGDVDTNLTTDYPAAAEDGTYTPLVTRHDYQVDLGASWSMIPVKLQKNIVSSSPIVISADTLRLKVNYPINGVVATASDVSGLSDDEKDAAPYLSASFPDNDLRIPDATSTLQVATITETITVPNGATLTDQTLTIPAIAGAAALTFADGSAFYLENCPCDLVLDAGTLTDATTLTGVSTIKVNTDDIAPVTADLSKNWIQVPVETTFASLGAAITLPNGSALTVVPPPENFSTYLPKVIMSSGTSVSATGIDIDGDLVVIDTGGSGDNRYDQILVPSSSSLSTLLGGSVTVGASLPPIPVGLRSLTVICDNDGELFDGDCSDGTTSAIAAPYQFTVRPRSYVQAPNPLIWNIN